MTPDEDQCRQYARFASHLGKWEFNIIYWTMFIANLMILFLASWTYTRAQEALERGGQQINKRRKQLRTYIYVCLGYFVLSITTVIMEAFSLLALEFCDGGSDFMALYYSTWTMLQVGSLIAILGIVLALLHSLKDRRHPPWALALGTPVLVIAGALHLIHDCTRRRVRKMRGTRKIDEGQEGPPISQVNTIQANDDDTIQGEFIGFTIEGGPIVRFSNASFSELPNNSELLGFCDGDRPIVAYRKSSIRFLNSEKPDENNIREEERVDPSGSV